MKRVEISWICISVLLLLMLGVFCSGCGKKVEVIDTSDPGKGGNSSQTSDAGSSGGSFQQFRDEHKNTFALMSRVGKIARLEKEQKAPLTAEQAKSLLAVLQPLRSQPTLTQDQAKEALKQVNAVLTDTQLTEIGKMKDRPRGNGSRGGQGRGQRPQMMKDFNPFNTPKDAPAPGRGRMNWDEFFTTLTQKANGGSTAAKE